MWHLRAARRELADTSLILAEDTFPISTTLVIASALLIVGRVAYFHMLGNAAGP